MKQLGVIVIIAILGWGIPPATAQETRTEPNSDANCLVFSPQDAVNALEAFEFAFQNDDWVRSFRGDDTRVSVTWLLGEPLAVAYLDYLIFSCGLPEDVFYSYFDNNYFQVTLSSYDTWARTRRCEHNDMMLLQFDVTSDNQPFLLRKWAIRYSDTRLIPMEIAVPAAELTMLDTYSQTLFPEFSSCESVE